MDRGMYKPLHLDLMTDDITDCMFNSLAAMRLPKCSYEDTMSYSIEEDLALAAKLISAGEDHAKFQRGIRVQIYMKMQIGFMVEFDTYRVGIDTLSTSSTMHGDLSRLSGSTLAIYKQAGLSTQVYERIIDVSYQTLARIHRQRRDHRHPDWQVFCDFIEGLPYANELIFGRSG
jgi:hypothetical protein